MAETDKVYPELIATFRPQYWQGDECVDLGRRYKFIATKKLLGLPLAEINKFQESCYDSDYLACDVPERLEHVGPFEVDVDIDSWLEANDCSPRSELSPEELETLRLRFGVSPPAGERNNSPKGGVRRKR